MMMMCGGIVSVRIVRMNITMARLSSDERPDNDNNVYASWESIIGAGVL